MSTCLNHPADRLLQGMTLTTDVKHSRAELTPPHTFEYAQELTLYRAMLAYQTDMRVVGRWTAGRLDGLR